MTERDRQRRRRETPSAAPARRGVRVRRGGRSAAESEAAEPRSADRPVRRPRGGPAASSAEEQSGGPPRRTGRPVARGRLLIGRILGRLGTRRTALLALVVCALALSVAVPMRTYLSQRGELETQLKLQQSLTAQQSQLEHREQELNDPAQAEAEIREQLRYVRPGQTPYVVQLPPGGASAGPVGAAPAPAPSTGQAWYQNLWNSVEGKH